jgi:hypothetical protein
MHTCLLFHMRRQASSIVQCRLNEYCLIMNANNAFFLSIMRI